MNPFENFMSPKKPDDTEQLRENTSEKYTGLIDDAKTKVEGILLYAPIPEEVRLELLDHLQKIGAEDEVSLEYFFKNEDRGSGPERTAALYVYRKMSGAISAMESILGRDEAERLERAVEHMYTEPNPYSDKLHKEYMNKGNDPTINN